jgi:hypothetical protein
MAEGKFEFSFDSPRDVLGVVLDSQQLAEQYSEQELYNLLAETTYGELDLKEQVVKLQGALQRKGQEKAALLEALRIAKDKGLE